MALEILNLHAQGGMAEVYRAQAVDAEGRSWSYAVKRMRPELLLDEEMMRMFVEEQRIAARLLHENIVRVYDVAQGEASDTFIVMEFLEGRDLSQVIEATKRQSRTLPVWLVIHVARALCHALHYASTVARDKDGRPLCLIHRDISPHNVVICLDGQVKLTDFGVARVETTEVRTRAGVIKGKFGYMSPEQLRGEALDFRSDLYNIGVLLYEALTGKRLFHGESVAQFIGSMMKNEVPPLAPALRVPPELDSLMRRALATDREERPASAIAFDAELNAIAGRYGLHATRAHVAAEMKILFSATAATATAPEPSSAASVVVSAEPQREHTKSRVLTMRVPLVHEAQSTGFGEPTDVTVPATPSARLPTMESTQEVSVITEPRRRDSLGFDGLAKTEPEGRTDESKP